MDQFRAASETRAAVSISVPAVSHKGPLQRPTGSPSARAPGPVSHMPTQRLGPVHQGWSDGTTEAGRDDGRPWRYSPEVAKIVLITAHLHFISRLGSTGLLASADSLAGGGKEGGREEEWGVQRPKAAEIHQREDSEKEQGGEEAGQERAKERKRERFTSVACVWSDKTQRKGGGI